MASFWEKFLPNRNRTNNEGLPRTCPEYPPDGRVLTPQIFDPALKQFTRAFRAGEPAFREPSLQMRWREMRRRTMDHMLQLVSSSSWRDNLVLRGSVLLPAWLGTAAREPGDMDWVILPQSMRPTDSGTREFLTGLVHLLTESEPPPGVELAREVAIDDIWTYERAPGKRIVFPWQAEGLPPAHVQMDFVFGETMWMPPVETAIPLLSGEEIRLLAASPELSLAWKLVWLETDMYPQGKDLYDATLLAERTRLPFELWKAAIRGADSRQDVPQSADFPLSWDIDWESFRAEYPWVDGSAEDWQRRLSRALQSSFAPAAMEN